MFFDWLKYSDHEAVITEDGRHMTYAELDTASMSVVSVMDNRRLTFCLCENTLGSIVGYLGLMNAHIPTVLLDGNKDTDTLYGLIQHYEPHYLWLPTRRINEFGQKKPLLEYEDYSLLELPFDSHEINPEILLCLTTSGTTGSPKLVKLTEQNLKSNAEAIAEYLHIAEEERAVTSLPMYYSFGMSVINSHLIKGATLLLTDKAVIQREFLDFLKEGKATSIAGVPYTYEMLRRLRFLKMDLPCLKTMIQAGGKLNAAIAKEYIEDAKAKDKRFIVMYGQTEAAPRMSYLPFKSALDKYASIGIAIPGGKLSVRDMDGHEITEPNVDGELIYEGPNVCMGYAECIEDLSKGDENRGILHTGDIAHFDEDGFFYITGRMKRFVKIWGNRCNLDATEQLVKTITVNCACVGVDDLITVFVTEKGKEEEIKAHLSEKTGLNIRAFDVKVIENIPTKESGKLDYQKLQAMIA